jgi:hypothetical protein
MFPPSSVQSLSLMPPPTLPQVSTIAPKAWEGHESLHGVVDDHSDSELEANSVMGDNIVNSGMDLVKCCKGALELLKHIKQAMEDIITTCHGSSL